MRSKHRGEPARGIELRQIEEVGGKADRIATGGVRGEVGPAARGHVDAETSRCAVGTARVARDIFAPPLRPPGNQRSSRDGRTLIAAALTLPKSIIALPSP